MRPIKKLIVVILSCAMCLSSVQLPVYAEPTNSDGIIAGETIGNGSQEVTEVADSTSQDETDAVGNDSRESTEPTDSNAVPDEKEETDEGTELVTEVEESVETTEEVTLEEGLIMDETETETTEEESFEFVNAGMPAEEVELENIHDGESIELQGTTLPSSFIPGLSDVPLPRNQGSLGTCYAFSSIGAIEANMIKKGASPSSLDYAELAVAYFTTNTVTDPLGGTVGDKNRYSDSELSSWRAKGHYDDVEGGNPVYTAPVLASWTGASSETLAPYYQASVSKKVTVGSDVAFNDLAHVQGWYKADLKNDRDAVKMMIQEFGGATLAYSAKNGMYLGSDGHSYYNYVDTSLNHFVTVVGWDDSYSRNNFNYSTARPASNGAWLVRNSWSSTANRGTTIADNYDKNKFFWISYYDTSLVNAVAFDVEGADNYDNNYQYDLGAYSRAVTTGSSFKAANVFTAKACENGEYIKAAAFEVYNTTNVNYTVKIYLDPVDGNPESGELVDSATTSGTTSYVGYYTVKLNEPVYVEEGERYAVVVELEKEGSSPAVSIEGNINSWFVTEVAIEEGCSYYASSGRWYDIKPSYGGMGLGNVKIKAFTDNATDEEPEDPEDPDEPDEPQEEFAGIEVTFKGDATEITRDTILTVDDFDISRIIEVSTKKQSTPTIIKQPVDTVLERENIQIEQEEIAENTTSTLRVKVSYTYDGRTVSELLRLNLAGADGRMEIKFSDGKDDYTYTGTAIKPAVTVKYKGRLLTEKKDYAVTYKNNVKAATSDSEKAPTITVTGKGDFSKSISMTFTISRKNVNDSDIIAGNVGVKSSAKAQKPLPTVKYVNKALVKNTAGAFTPANGIINTSKDMTITYRDSDDDDYNELSAIPADASGTYYIHIEGTGNYCGERNIKLNISDTLMSSARVTFYTDNLRQNKNKTAKYKYADRPADIKRFMKVELSVKYGNNTIYRTLSDSEYSINEYDKDSVGIKTLVLTSEIPEVAGSKTVSYQVVGTPLSSVAKIVPYDAQPYTGSEIVKAPKVVLKQNENRTLKNGTDYAVTYLNNTKAGTATVTVTGLNGYTDKLTARFRIEPKNITELTITNNDPDQMVKYVKGGAVPSITVKDGDKVLTQGVDYKVTCSKNTKVSPTYNYATYQVIMMGNYSGKTSGMFTVINGELEDTRAEASDITIGSKINKSKITITDTNGKLLAAGADYDTRLTEYYPITAFDEDGEPLYDEDGIPVHDSSRLMMATDNIPDGIQAVCVIVYGKGNYTGEQATWFRVVKYDINKAVAATIAQAYSGGDQVIPGAAVFKKLEYKNGTEIIPLTEGVHYEIVGYENNTKRGAAKIVIRGIGDFGGSKKINFTIGARSLFDRVLSFFS